MGKEKEPGGIKTVEIPSRDIAARLAAKKGTTPAERAEFARALVEDAKRRAADLVSRRVCP